MLPSMLRLFDQMCHVQSACPSFVAVGGREGTVSSRLIGTRGEGNMAGVRPKTGSDFFFTSLLQCSSIKLSSNDGTSFSRWIPAS